MSIERNAKKINFNKIKRKFMKKYIFRGVLFILAASLLVITVFAHSGRTDSSGGHNDNVNGGYHYHCGGNSAHSHTDGVCPYDTNTEPTIESTYTYDTTESTIEPTTSKPVEITTAKPTEAPTEPKPVIIEVFSVKINAVTKPMYVDDSIQLSAVISPDNANNKSIKWSSSNNVKATVSSSGMLIAKSAGSVVITATSTNGKKGSITIKIEKAPISSANVHALKVGDKLGDVLNTNVKTYINGERIPCYNIENKAVVLIADLRNYGFDTVYDNAKRSTTITRNYDKKFTPIKNIENNTEKAGTIAFSYLYTDITAIVNEEQVDSFNIKGNLAIYFSSLGDYGAFEWDSKTNSSKLTLNKES